jgi:hypothetical protein
MPPMKVIDELILQLQGGDPIMEMEPHTANPLPLHPFHLSLNLET